MSFNPLKAFKRHRIARAGVGLLVLAGAALAEYKLANVPRPVNLETTGRFSPATIRLGQAELVIGGPVVDSKERLLFSHEGKPNETVDISSDHARLDEDTREMFEHFGARILSTPTQIDYRAEDPTESSASLEPCHTRVEILAASKMPDEIHIFQLGDPGANSFRHLRMRAKGAELVLNLVTRSPSDNSEGAPGCQYVIRVGDWHDNITALDLTAVNSEDSDLRLNFRRLMRDSTPWADTEGVLPLDLGTQQLTPASSPPPFQARSVSIKSLDLGNPRTLLSAISDGPLLTIRDLKIGSDQIQLTIAGTGWVKIDGKPWTVNFLDRLMENKILAALLAAANAALLALVARLIFKTPSTKPVRRGKSQ